MTAGWDLVQALLRDDPARPRLVHYDLAPGGLRVELGGKALANWVAKVANLLTDECDAEPGDTAVLGLPPVHWRTATWVLGCWAAGVRPVAPGAAEAVTGPVRLAVAEAARAADDAPGGAPPEHRGGLALPALARDAGPLPAGALDLNAEVQNQPDLFLPPPGPGTTLPGGCPATAPVTATGCPDLAALGALLAGTLPGPRPLVLVSGLPGASPEENAQTLARIAADERLGA